MASQVMGNFPPTAAAVCLNQVYEFPDYQPDLLVALSGLAVASVILLVSLFLLANGSGLPWLPHTSKKFTIRLHNILPCWFVAALLVIGIED